jgi:hypothetical protein
MKKLVIFTHCSIITFFALSCGKDEEPKIEEFPMEYVFYNNGSNQLFGVVMHTWTFYPSEISSNKACWSGDGKFRNRTDDHHLDDYDSLSILPKDNVYAGCQYKCEVNVIITYNDTSKYGYNIFEYTTYVRTIEKKENAKIVVTWPDDSLSFTKR